MNVLNLPVEVIDTYILPYLGWNDLLKLRSTCKKFKNLADDYIRRHPEMAPELEIKKTKERNFRAFLAMGIPFNKIFLNNQSGNQFYDKLSTFAAQFLQDYGPLVTHLRVDKFSMWCTEKEKQFLEGFPNLVSFEASQTTLEQGGFGHNPNNLNKTNFPTVFGRLKVLGLHQTYPAFRLHVNWLEELLGSCQSLEHFCSPFPTRLGTVDEDAMDKFFGILNATVLQRNGKDVNGQGSVSKIQVIEFNSSPDNHVSSAWNNRVRAQQAFHQLLETCAGSNVRLVNVHDQWLSVVLLQNRRLQPQQLQIGTPLTSLTLDKFSRIFLLDMPNLEKLILKSCHVEVIRGLPPCNLPNLKSLELTLDSWNSIDTLRYFFEGVVHDRMTNLHITFLKRYPEFERMLSVVLRRLRDTLVLACPRLETLRFTFEDLEGNCDDLVAMLEGFEALEEVNFIRCWELKNADFIGPNAENPRFHRLTRLRRVSMIGLESMPNVTDVLFSSVIRNMKLTHLKITATEPIRSVTLPGFESLMYGPFSESIKEFTFSGRCLRVFSLEDVKMLGERFRPNYITREL